MATKQARGLSLIASRTMPDAIQIRFVSSCPTMDLLAVVTVEERVDVHRFNGQRAFGLQRKDEDVTVESLCWKYNGECLAVSWSDHSVDVISTESGNSLQNFRQITGTAATEAPIEQPLIPPISCLGWGLSLIDVQAAKGRTKSSKTDPSDKLSELGKPRNQAQITLDDFLERIPDLDAIDIPLEIPDQLARIDVTELMPKLPPLTAIPMNAYRPGRQSYSDLFSSQVSLDAALHRASSSELNALNSFLISDRRGTIRVIAYDSLGVGNVSLWSDWNLREIQHLKHSAHPFSKNHIILSSVELQDGSKATALTPLCLRFLKIAGRNINFIDYKTAQLGTLVQYVEESLSSLHYHWKHALDLPSRFQRNVQETLEEKQEPNLAQSLYQLAVTGYCSEPLKEWLVDELGDRGHKRWDHSISQGYTKVLELVQENLLPALDRCTMYLSHLQALAQYHEYSPAFDVPASAFTLILNIVKCLRLLAHHIRISASEEHIRFEAFSQWLKHAIEVQAADPSTATGEEVINKDPGVDFNFVLGYIKGAMEGSKIDQFLVLDEAPPKITATPENFEDLRKALGDIKSGRTPKQDLLKLWSYFDEWQTLNETLLRHITSWQRRNTIMPGSLLVLNSEVSSYDIRTIYEETSPETFMTYTGLVGVDSKSSLSLQYLLYEAVFDELPGCIKEHAGVMIDFVGVEIIDFKFIDDQDLLLLVSTGSSSHLISFPYARDSSSLPKAIKYALYEPPTKGNLLPNGRASERQTGVRVQTLEEFNDHIKHSFPSDQNFTPIRIEVNGRKNRRTCSVVGDDCRTIKILDLDYSEDEAKDAGRVDAVLGIKRQV